MRKINSKKRKHSFFKKRGSAVVLLMIGLSVISAGFAFIINSAKDKAIEGSVNSLGRIWTASILGEYDMELLKRYDIFGYYGTPHIVDEKIKLYADHSFSKKKYIDMRECRSSLYDYALTDTKIFKRQITESAKVMTAKSLIENKEDDYFNDNIAEDKTSTRELRSKKIIKGLPSYGRDDEGLLERAKRFFSGILSIQDIIKTGTDAYLINRYIDEKFSSALDRQEDEGRYLQYEKEYIICGKKSDPGNLKGTKTRLIALREALNMAYLHTDSEKSSQILAAAELISPPPLVPATQETIIAAWALAESINDYKRLINGKKVPLMKDDKSWAIDIESVINNKESGYIDTEDGEGSDYEDYLDALIYIMDEETKLTRMMDLIQISMKFCCYRDFNLKNYYAGLSLHMDVNGRKYKFTDEY